MFVQIIEGRMKDPEGVKRLAEQWHQELRPGAEGYLGSTAGATDDGRGIAIVRFDSSESAQANSERPEQTEWFEKLAQFYDGEPTFVESTDTEEFMGGGSNDAGFVQVMKLRGVDRGKMKELDKQFENFAGERADLLGTFRVWTGPDTCIEAAYFSSEAEARAGESKELSPDMQKVMADLGEIMANTEYLDLKDPIIY